MKIYVVGSSKNKFFALNNIREKYLIDAPHKGDNIDFLNPWYCELTGLYYLWKHVDDDIIGLEHYRRYFANNKNKPLEENEIRTILTSYDLICHYKRKYTAYKSIEEELIKITKDEKTIKRFKEYIKTADSTFDMNKVPYKHSFNMLIGHKNIINEILDQLFYIIGNFIIKYNIKEMKSRIIGYISEFYLSHLLLKYNIKETNVFNQKINRLA